MVRILLFIKTFFEIFGKHEIVLLFVFLINQLVERSGIYIPIIHSYLDDLLAVPLTLAMTRFIMFFIHTETFTSLYTSLQVGIVVAMFSAYFEWYLPSRYDVHHRDFFDIICYALGGVYYMEFLQNFKKSN